MTKNEFNERCHNVFVSREGDEYCSISKVGDTISIEMSEIEDTGRRIGFPYCPDMTDRPQALSYLLGERDDFND